MNQNQNQNQCEDSDFIQHYGWKEGDVFTAKVNDHFVNVITTVLGANKIEVKILAGNYSKGDTLTVFKNGALVQTINIIECP